MAQLEVLVAPIIAFSRNPIPLHIEAGNDWANAGSTANPTIFQLVFSSNVISVGEELTLHYNGIIYSFVVSASPSAEELEIQNNGSLSIQDWIDDVLIATLQNNYALANIGYFRSGSTLFIIADYETNLVVSSTIAPCTVSNSAVGNSAVYPAGYKIYATVMKKGLADYVFSKVAELSAIPEATIPYPAKFDLQEIAESIVSRTLPDFGQEVIKIAANNYAEIKVNYAQKINGVYRDNHETAFGVLFGGVNLAQYPIYGPNYPINASEKFLTWQPSNKRTTPNSQEYLYLLPIFDLGSSSTIDLIILVECFKNGTTIFLTELFPVDTYQKFAPIIIPCGLTSTNMATVVGSSILEETDYYEISVEEAYSSSRIARHGYSVDRHDYNGREKYFLIGNSLGGFDTLVCTTNHSESFAVKKESYTQTLEWNFEAYQGQTKNLITEAQTKYKVNTGLVDKDYIKYLKELLISDEIYLIENGNYYPVSIVGDSFNLYQNNAHIYSLEFEYIMNYQELNYSNITA